MEERRLDDLRPDVREYLLKWKEFTYSIALALVAAAWLIGQMQIVWFCDDGMFFEGLLLCLFYLMTALAQSLARVIQPRLKEQWITLALMLFCCACPLGLLTDNLLLRTAALGFTGGVAIREVIREIQTVHSLRQETAGKYPLTVLAVAGLAGILAVAAYLVQGRYPEGVSYMLFLFSAGALGIHLKYRKNPPTPQ